MIGGMNLTYHAGDEIVRNVAAGIDAARAGAKAQSAHEKYRQLEERVEKLILLNLAMWELIKERTQLTEADLVKRVAEIDLRDGVADGKITRTVKKCKECGKVMSSRHSNCLYCGAIDLAAGPFDEI